MQSEAHMVSGCFFIEKILILGRLYEKKDCMQYHGWLLLLVLMAMTNDGREIHMIHEVFEILKRDAVGIYNEKDLLAKLTSQKKLRVKLGADPSRPDLHLGHSVVLRKLKLLQALGHEIIFVIGDFTGMIGDPSGRSKTRQPLSFEETRANGQTYLEQVTKILDPEKTRIVYNSDWLNDMNFAEVLQLTAKYTLARIMERDDFEKRYKNNQPIGLHELMYPLMQGYDSVALEADIEVGGTDQTFNLLVGRELQRDYGQQAQVVITFPLLVGLDGKEKMSKSLDNYIGLDEAPAVMFEKCMKVPDELLVDYFRLTTDLPQASYEMLLSQDMHQAHFLLAETIVTMYHSIDDANQARIRYEEVSKGGIPEDIKVVQLSKHHWQMTELLLAVGLTKSKGEGRRLIMNHGIKVDNVIVEDPYMQIKLTDDIVISRGKNKFVRVSCE